MILPKELLNSPFQLIPACLNIVKGVLSGLETGKVKLKIPRPGDERKKTKNSHFHLTPEVFFQISGVNIFEFPREKFGLYANEICIVPSGIPHFETAEEYKGQFYTLVNMFNGQNISFHVCNESTGIPGTQHMLGIEYFHTENTKKILSYLEELALLYWKNNFESQISVKGLLMAYLGNLLSVLNEKKPINLSKNAKVGLCKKLIISNLSDPSLNVQKIAGWIHCSPDYLSWLFHKETGEYLSGYIHNEKMLQAKHLLETSSLNISEIAWACGYGDASYFARLFKKITGKTSKEYRKINFIG
jgi:AraC-like DNA-binding protein